MELSEGVWTLVACYCEVKSSDVSVVFFFQAEDGIRDLTVTGVQTCALPISCSESVAFRPVPLTAPRFLPRGTSLASRAPNNGEGVSTCVETDQNPSSQGGENDQGFQDEPEELPGVRAGRTTPRGCGLRHPGRDRDPAVLAVSLARPQR